jgi:ferrous iron transport protein A
MMMRKLSAVKAGERGRIASINGDARFLSRITSIGLTIGSVVEVIQNQKRRPMLVYGRDTMIAINRKECEKIMLEVMPNEQYDHCAAGTTELGKVDAV